MSHRSRGTQRGPVYGPWRQKCGRFGPQARSVIDIEAPVADNLQKIARAKGEDIEDLTVVILDRARHQELITEVRKTGARIRMIPDGDASGITSGDLLHGVDYYADGARTDSLVVRGLTGTVHRIIANHRFDKLNRISSLEY